MTLAAVWKVGERVYAIADTRISRSRGNVLTEHGPKLLPIFMLCKQPGQSGFFDRIAYGASFGFAYAGSTLSALSTHAFSNTLCQNLVGPSGVAPAGLDEIAVAIGEIACRYMREIGQLSGHEALFSAIVFGFCIRAERFRAFQLAPILKPDQLLQVHVSEHDLYCPETLLVIGSRPDLLQDRVCRDRPSLYANLDGSISPDMQELREIDLPRRALAAIVAEGADETIGGATQEAWVTRAGFEPVSRLVPITPLPAGRNATTMALGFDMYEFNNIGSYFFSLTGRF
jgi:hypothetical protein